MDASRSSCASFWGPFRPWFGGHTLKEVGTSRFFPTWLVLAWRAAFAIYMGTTLIVYLARDTYNFEFYSIWCHLGIAIAFSLSALASLLYLFKRAPHRDSISFFASFVLLWVQVFATAALFLDVVYWALLFDSDTSPSLAVISQHAINFGFVLLDLFLSLRMQFKLLYGLVFVVYTIAYVVFAWIRFAITDDWVYGFLDYRRQSAAVTVAYYFGILAWAAVATIILILITRIGRCLGSTSRNKRLESDREDGNV